MNQDWIFDVETYANVFLFSAEHAEFPFTVTFEISDWRNDSADLIAWLHWLRGQGGRLVGFNNVGFDYPIVHLLARMGNATAQILYDKAQSIIAAQDDDRRFEARIKPSDYLVPQIDLYLIHHFDNRARSTGLKALEFNMRSERVLDLPFPVGATLTRDQVPVLLEYNQYDIAQTKRFYHHTLPMLRFREELNQRYPQREWLNLNDTAIGKTYFIMALEQAGVSCYDYSRETGRTPRQTRRPSIALKDAILPSLSFETPEFQRVLDWLRQQTITETKGVFKDLVATVNGFDFVFGTGGIHGSVNNEIFDTTMDQVVVDLDVSSYYPNLAIQNKFAPAHLGETFCAVYDTLYRMRQQYAKGTAENAMLKLALNGCFGDAGNPYSVFHDPLFLLQITLQGQLLICLLAEQLTKISRIIQCNTDGITILVPRMQLASVMAIRQWWEEQTGLTLEQATYRRMCIRDVNNYIAQYEDRTAKRVGAYEYEVEWHQDHSALVVPKIAEKVLLEGAPIRQTVENWSDKMDFLLRVKVPRTGYLSIEQNATQHQLPNTTRYAVTRSGGRMYKWLPPVKGSDAWRRTAIQASWNVTPLNDLRRVDLAQIDFDMDFYTDQVERLCNGLS